MTPIYEIAHTEPKKVKFDWVSDGDGNASATTHSKHSGSVCCVSIVHDKQFPPIAAYDVYVYNDDGGDILCGEGKDIAPIVDKVLTREACALGSLADSKLSFNISGAGGAGKKGSITVYL